MNNGFRWARLPKSFMAENTRLMADEETIRPLFAGPIKDIVVIVSFPDREPFVIVVLQIHDLLFRHHEDLVELRVAVVVVYTAVAREPPAPLSFLGEQEQVISWYVIDGIHLHRDIHSRLFAETNNGGYTLFSVLDKDVVVGRASFSEYPVENERNEHRLVVVDKAPIVILLHHEDLLVKKLKVVIGQSDIIVYWRQRHTTIYGLQSYESVFSHQHVAVAVHLPEESDIIFEIEQLLIFLEAHPFV